MSGIAAAKKRRANIQSNTPEPPRLPNGGLSAPNQQPNQQQQGLTLQQVISLLDSRITKLERETTNNNNPSYSQTTELLPSNISEILDDFQQKFVILAGEINSLKDTVLKLQSYTMEVNKVLLEERIQILSDIGDNCEDRFLLNNDNQSQNSNNDENNNSENDMNESTKSEVFKFDTLDTIEDI
jgi:hypothetical protein